MAEYTPRLNSDGMQDNPYWYSLNPFYQAGYGLPNCTCYAWGRWYEITGERPRLSTGNAEDWFGYTADGYERGSVPQLGAIICFADGPYSGAGHVAVVEEINGDRVTFSNSAYGGGYFYLKYGTASNNYGYETEYRLQGFIYNDSEPVPPQPPTPTGSSFKWLFWLKPQYKLRRLKRWL